MAKKPGKLVRKRIPEICEANGQTPYYHTIEDDEEYLGALFEKDEEETGELWEAVSEDSDPETRRAHILGELADKAEVLCALTDALGFTPEEVEAARQAKLRDRGGFGDRTWLDRVE